MTIRLGQTFSGLLQYFAQHFSLITSLIFNQNWVVTVFSVSTEPFFVSESTFYLFAITYSKIIQKTQKWVLTCSNILWTFPISLSLKIWLCNVKWDWLMPHDVFFLKSMKNCSRQQKHHIKPVQKHIWKQQHNSFLMRAYLSKLDKWFRN